MLKTTVKALISVSFCLGMMMPASAVPLQKPAVEMTGSSDVVQIRHNKRGFYRHNNRGYYNGHRGYRHQRRGYRQQNGYWFPPAAFALGAIIGGALNNNNNYNGNVRPGYTNPQHVGWCYNKYRSYRERDNSFQPYQGGRRECRSPYY